MPIQVLPARHVVRRLRGDGARSAGRVADGYTAFALRIAGHVEEDADDEDR